MGGPRDRRKRLRLDHQRDAPGVRDQTASSAELQASPLTAAHDNVNSSAEEAARVVLVVAPYNSQVQLITEHLTALGYPNARVGTVDKFGDLPITGDRPAGGELAGSKQTWPPSRAWGRSGGHGLSKAIPCCLAVKAMGFGAGRQLRRALIIARGCEACCSWLASGALKPDAQRSLTVQMTSLW